MSETIDHFELWEEDTADIDVPNFPEELSEHHIESAMDPIVGAHMIQQYIETQPPDAQEALLRKYIDHLNYHFGYEYIDRPVEVTAHGDFGMPEPNQAFDMMNLLVELQSHDDVRVGGKMGFFEKHFYTDEENSVRRPIISLRMYHGAFLKDEDPVGIENYVTLPITAVFDYRFGER